MKKSLFTIALLAASTLSAQAIDDTTVEIVYSGTTATVTVADNIASYVTVSSGESSHVVIVQDNDFAGVDATDDNTTGEITYILSGSSTDGSFQITGKYKCTISLAGVTLTNASGPALLILNGKRIKVSAKRDTENTLTATSTSTYNGGIYCKGHIELQGNGTLNVTDSYAHAIKAKEYCQIKNLTLNITSAAKDGINCKEYCWMKSGTVTISGFGGDGIETSLDGLTSSGEVVADENAGIEAHEDEDSGNFYQDGGTLTITRPSSNTTGALIQVDGTEVHNGGIYNDTDYTAIDTVTMGAAAGTSKGVYDLTGRRLPVDATPRTGIYITTRNNKTTKSIFK